MVQTEGRRRVGVGPSVIAAILKTAVGESPPGVRIPPHPLSRSTYITSENGEKAVGTSCSPNGRGKLANASCAPSCVHGLFGMLARKGRESQRAGCYEGAFQVLKQRTTPTMNTTIPARKTTKLSRWGWATAILIRPEPIIMADATAFISALLVCF